ncbi:hypothetical protein Tco_0784788, partial [Tanacetum coccineum]
ERTRPTLEEEETFEGVIQLTPCWMRVALKTSFDGILKQQDKKIIASKCRITTLKNDRRIFLKKKRVGAGTNPLEGAVLGLSLLECFAEAGAFNGAFENACMEFDEVNLKPPYNVLRGIPGCFRCLIPLVYRAIMQQKEEVLCFRLLALPLTSKSTTCKYWVALLASQQAQSVPALVSASTPSKYTFEEIDPEFLVTLPPIQISNQNL